MDGAQPLLWEDIDRKGPYLARVHTTMYELEWYRGSFALRLYYKRCEAFFMSKEFFLSHKKHKFPLYKTYQLIIAKL